MPTSLAFLPNRSHESDYDPPEVRLPRRMNFIDRSQFPWHQRWGVVSTARARGQVSRRNHLAQCPAWTGAIRDKGGMLSVPEGGATQSDEGRCPL